MIDINIIDCNGNTITSGDVIDIHQTVNGCNIFIVEFKDDEVVVTYGCNMVVARVYEYDIKELFEPCKYTGEVDFEIVGNVNPLRDS